LAVSSENVTRLKAEGDSQHINLLLHMPEDFLDHTEDFALDNNDRLRLLAEGEMTTSEQLQLIATITPEMIDASAPLATRIGEVLVSTDKLNLDEEKLKALVMTGTGQRAKLLLFDRNLPGLDHGMIRELLAGIGGEYERLNRGKRPTVPLNNLSESIAVQLEDSKFISSKHIDREKGTVKMVGRP
jgi:hypothetical protein